MCLFKSSFYLWVLFCCLTVLLLHVEERRYCESLHFCTLLSRTITYIVIYFFQRLIILSVKLKLSHFSWFYVKIWLSHTPSCQLKSAINVAMRQSVFYGVKFAITCNLFLIIQQLTVIKGQKAQTGFCLHRLTHINSHICSLLFTVFSSI